MNREELAAAVLKPVDGVLGGVMSTAERAGVLPWASHLLYWSLRRSMKANLVQMNDLDIEGADNVPSEGGVILACNHQSWLDAQVLGASCPRRVHFIAKSEFQSWPVLRHVIPLTQSVFIHRGGDEEALESIVDALRDGWAVAIFPEGTIPGEEEVPRHAIDPKTGLLPGHTGVARLALGAGVPVIPVGISGTGRAFPPEIYPRLEILRLPGKTPVRIRFGRAVDQTSFADVRDERVAFRAFTDHVMSEISKLVDHRANYVPIDVPLPEPPRREKVGVLLLHGFTSHVDTVAGLVPHLEAAGIQYEMPILRGHGTRYQDLRGVTARDWYVDAERALIGLWNWVERVVVVGLSMGGLLALELGMRHPDKIAGVVTVAAALKFLDPKVKLAPVAARLTRYMPSPDPFNDAVCRSRYRNYPRFPTDAFASLYAYSREIASRLRELHVPIRILQSKKDQIVAPEAANIIYEKVSSPHREIIWYHESGHEMMQDLEAEKVFRDIMEFVRRFQVVPAEEPS
jgi:carboxylesterase